MSDYKSVTELCAEYPNLNEYIHQLEQRLKDYEQFTIRTCPPNKTYKQLEEELKNFEVDKNREIDELWATKIKPLREKVEQYEKSLELSQSMTVNDGMIIKELRETIKDQQTIINYAAGYISACEQFREKHPNDVVKWLFKGLE
jgi:hypothetical protein